MLSPMLLGTESCCEGVRAGCSHPPARDPGPVTSTRFQQRPLQPLVHAGVHQMLLTPPAGDKRWAPPPSLPPCFSIPVLTPLSA